MKIKSEGTLTRKERILNREKDQEHRKSLIEKGLPKLILNLKKAGFRKLKRKSNNYVLSYVRRIKDKRSDFVVVDTDNVSMIMTTVLSAEGVTAFREKRKKIIGFGEKEVRVEKKIESHEQFVISVTGGTYPALLAKAERRLQAKAMSGLGISVPPNRLSKVLESLSSDYYSKIMDLSSVAIENSKDPEANLEYLVRVGGEKRDDVAERILQKLNIKVTRGKNKKLSVRRAIDRAKNAGKKPKEILKATYDLLGENRLCSPKK